MEPLTKGHELPHDLIVEGALESVSFGFQPSLVFAKCQLENL